MNKTKFAQILAIFLVAGLVALWAVPANAQFSSFSGGGSGTAGATGPSGPSGPSGPAGTPSFDCQTWPLWIPTDKDHATFTGLSTIAAPTTVALGCTADLGVGGTGYTWPAALTDVGSHVVVNMDYFTFCSLDYFGDPSSTAGTFGAAVQDYTNAAAAIAEITWNSGDSSTCASKGSVSATDLTAKTGNIVMGLQVKNSAAGPIATLGLSAVYLRCCTGTFTP